jgi:ferredoxin-NADP reductase
MSVIRYLTDRAWPHEIYLLFTCRSPDEYLFREELERLERRHPNLHLVVTMTRSEGTTWAGTKGRLTKEMIAQSVPKLTERRVHVCGPSAMMDATKGLLLELGVPRDNIKMEAFGPAEKPHERQATVQAAITEAPAATTPTVAFTISGKTVPLPAGTTVLEAAEHVGIAIDASCRAGTCGTCKVRLRKGSVTMAVQDGISPDEKSRGLILACQAKATENLEVEA